MKATKLIVLALLAASCGRKGSPRTYYYGRDGIDGKAGKDGSNAVIKMVSFSGVSGSCTNGGITILSATDANDSGSLDSEDTNLVSSTVCNGTNGLDGSDGQDGADGQDAPVNSFTPVAILDPCGNHPSYFDEVMLKLHNGQVLASFSDNASGLNTRFSILGAGSYRTTDGTNCYFSIDSNGNMYNEHY